MPKLMKFNLHWSGVGEEGQIGVYCTPGGVNSLSQVENAVNGARDEIASASYLTQLKVLLSLDQKLDKVSGYLYDTDAAGGALYGATAAFAGSGIAGTGAQYNPLQVSMVCTLLTGHSGASFRGRVYLPAQGLPFGVHKFIAADVDATIKMLAGDVGKDGLLWDFARACDAAADGGADPVVYSRKLNQANVITSVKADDVPDIQRRRAMSEAPTHVAEFPLVEYTG